MPAIPLNAGGWFYFRHLLNLLGIFKCVAVNAVIFVQRHAIVAFALSISILMSSSKK